MSGFMFDRKIAHEIKYEILNSDYKPGVYLPSERELAAKFGVQRATVRTALQMLVEQGLIVAKERSGYYVSESRYKLIINEENIGWRISSEKNDFSMKIISYELLEANKKQSERFRIPIGTKLHKVRRVIEESKRIIAIEGFYALESSFPELLSYNLNNNFIFSIMEDKGIDISKSLYTTNVVYANEEEKKLFDVPLSSPLMKEKVYLANKYDIFASYAYIVAPIKNMEILVDEW